MARDTVLVTRPAHQAGPLLSLLSEAGVKAEAFPVIEITSRKLSEQEQHMLLQLANYDLVFFISANAVDESMPLIQAHGGFAKHTQVAVVGPATQAALQTHEIETDILSSTVFNSEGLLAEPALQEVAGKRVLIFRGVGGRTLLSDTLIARGAKVDSIASYQRSIPLVDGTLLKKRLSSLRAIVVMSNESLDNLCTIVEQDSALQNIPLVVISERTAKHAKQQGLSAIIALNPSDKEVFRCVMRLENSEG